MEALSNFWSEIVADLNENSFYFLRMILASLCGAFIGLERSRRQKDAGIRTHMIVALGSALTMLISKYGFFDVVVFDGINLDASRIAANVTTGVSFLGAGVIFVKDVSIKGLTTAAGIWTTAAVGLAIGAGMYSVGICATILMIILQFILHKYFNGLENTANEFTVIIKDNHHSAEEFKDSLKELNIIIESCKMIRESDETVKLVMTIKKSRTIDMDVIMDLAQKNDDIISIEI